MLIPAPSEVIDEWTRRVESEYTSVSYATQILQWALKLGLSPDTIKECIAFLQEEYIHVEQSYAILTFASGREIPVPINEQALLYPEVPATSDTLMRALTFTADFLCCGESVGSNLFRAMAKNATVPKVKEFLQAVVADETAHGNFGWDLLDELLERANDGHITVLREKIPSFIERIKNAYHSDHVHDNSATKWGLLQGSQYHDITTLAINNILIPKFKERHLYRTIKLSQSHVAQRQEGVSL